MVFQWYTSPLSPTAGRSLPSKPKLLRPQPVPAWLPAGLPRMASHHVPRPSIIKPTVKLHPNFNGSFVHRFGPLIIR